jgi:hypothetical protein
MKHVISSVMSTVFILVLILSSCSKVDWNRFKDKQGEKFLVPDCDVKRVYTLSEGGSTKVQMQKEYYPTGRVKKIAFYTYSGTSEDVFWHSFLLDYDLFNLTVNITDSSTGSVVLKAFFTRTSKLEQLEKLGFDNSPAPHVLTFEYAAGRLEAIQPAESFTYDSNGNMVRRQVGMSEASIYNYGASATDKRQFYIPQYNYMIHFDPTMALLEYLGWIDFSPKNVRISIRYLAPLPNEEIFSGHVFDAGGKLTSYSMGGQLGDSVGSKKYIDWTCNRSN